MTSRNFTIRLVPLAFMAAATWGCGADEEGPIDTAEEVYEAHANNLDQAADRVEGAQAEQLEAAAEAQRERADQIEERPGEVAAVPVIVDGNATGVQGTAWKFEETKPGETKR